MKLKFRPSTQACVTVGKPSRGDTDSNETGKMKESNRATKLLGGKYYNETPATHSQLNHLLTPKHRARRI